MTDLIAIKNAQLTLVRELIDVELAGSQSDDHYDYLTAGLALAERVCHIAYLQDETAFQELLNTGLDEYACDGICQAIYDLNPLSLKED